MTLYGTASFAISVTIGKLSVPTATCSINRHCTEKALHANRSTRTYLKAILGVTKASSALCVGFEMDAGGIPRFRSGPRGQLQHNLINAMLRVG